jgi:hypothetical protein
MQNQSVLPSPKVTGGQTQKKTNICGLHKGIYSATFGGKGLILIICKVNDLVLATMFSKYPFGGYQTAFASTKKSSELSGGNARIRVGVQLRK